MEKILWELDKNEVSYNKLLAYTIAKINPFAQCKISLEENKLAPPRLVWRFYQGDRDLYQKLKRCIESFNGGIKWAMSGGDIGINYVIEPLECYNISKSEGQYKLDSSVENIMGDKYKDFCEKAILDIPHLCRYIEETFNVVDSKPFYPVY